MQFFSLKVQALLVNLLNKVNTKVCEAHRSVHSKELLNFNMLSTIDAHINPANIEFDKETGAVLSTIVVDLMDKHNLSVITAVSEVCKQCAVTHFINEALQNSIYSEYDCKRHKTTKATRKSKKNSRKIKEKGKEKEQTDSDLNYMSSSDLYKSNMFKFSEASDFINSSTINDSNNTDSSDKLSNLDLFLKGSNKPL